MKAVHFGAGNIGRGFIGSLLSESGFEVCFVDINSEMVNRLNNDKFYIMRILEGTENFKKISPVKALNSLTQEDEIIMFERRQRSPQGKIRERSESVLSRKRNIISC